MHVSYPNIAKFLVILTITIKFSDWKGSWEVVNLNNNVQPNIEFDANVFSKKKSETRIQRLNVQSYLPDKYRRKLSSELSGFLHR